MVPGPEIGPLNEIVRLPLLVTASAPLATTAAANVWAVVTPAFSVIAPPAASKPNVSPGVTPRVYAAGLPENRMVVIGWVAPPRVMAVLPLPGPSNVAVPPVPG